jgi:hypothetical protein
MRAEATRRVAGDSLDETARALGDARLREALETVADHRLRTADERRSDRRTRSSGRNRRPGPSGTGAPDPDDPRRRSRSRRRGGGHDGRASEPDPTPDHVRAAEELIDRARRNEARRGERWTRRDLDRLAREDRRLLRESRDPADHAHRIGLDRRRFERLQGAERERAEERIEKARRRDLGRLEVSAEDRHPAGQPALLAFERLRQIGEGALPERLEHLRALRRERRGREYPDPRRRPRRGA